MVVVILVFRIALVQNVLYAVGLLVPNILYPIFFTNPLDEFHVFLSRWGGMMSLVLCGGLYLLSKLDMDAAWAATFATTVFSIPFGPVAAYATLQAKPIFFVNVVLYGSILLAHVFSA